MPVTIMVEITGGTTKIAVPVICLQSENNMQCKLYQYNIGVQLLLVSIFILKTIIDIKTNTLLVILHMDEMYVR